MRNKIKNFFKVKNLAIKDDGGLSLIISEADLEKIRRHVYQTSQHEAHVADEHLLKVIRAFTDVCFINHSDKFIRTSKFWEYEGFIKQQCRLKYENKKVFKL